VLLSVVITLVNLSWVLRDNAAPSWDQSHYLYLTWVYQQALDHHGPGALVHAIYTTDPSHAPLLSVLLVPLSYIFGPGTGVGLALNLILWPIFLLSAGAIAREFFDDRARLLAIVLLAPMPLIVTLSHQVLQDFLLVTLTTVAVLLLVRSHRLTGRKASLGLGLAVGAGLLTKFSFFVGFAGPALVTLIACVADCVTSRRLDGDWRAARRPITNMVLAASVAVIPTLLWYVPNWTATVAYIKTQFSGQGGATFDPLSPVHLAAFFVNTGANMSWLAVGIAVIVAMISIPRLSRWFLGHRVRRAAVLRAAVLRAAFLGSWLFIPIVVVAADINQDPRYLVASYPALAVITGGLISQITRPIVRRVMVSAVVIATGVQILQVNVPHYRTPLLPASINFHTPGGWISIPFRAGDGPAVVPAPTNVTLEILQYLESQSRRPDRRIKAAIVLLPELEPTANGNDLSYYAAIRHDPFTFVTAGSTETKKQLIATLQDSNFVLYVRQPSLTTGAGINAISQLNQSDVARQMTPAMFALFSPHPKHIYIGADSPQSPYLAVLERRET
jgi:4-amino-4-deoxy-L-arabinose transferase-like glycosyltransferase